MPRRAIDPVFGNLRRTDWERMRSAFILPKQVLGHAVARVATHQLGNRQASTFAPGGSFPAMQFAQQAGINRNPLLAGVCDFLPARVR